jgi:hypothetical protein
MAEQGEGRERRTPGQAREAGPEARRAGGAVSTTRRNGPPARDDLQPNARSGRSGSSAPEGVQAPPPRQVTPVESGTRAAPERAPTPTSPAPAPTPERCADC